MQSAPLAQWTRSPRQALTQSAVVNDNKRADGIGSALRISHVDHVAENDFQSIISQVPKSQFDTLDCTLEELAILELVAKNPAIKQQELAEATGKSIATVKRVMKSLQDKNYIRRESKNATINGKCWFDVKRGNEYGNQQRL